MNARRGLPPPTPLDPAVAQWVADGPGSQTTAGRLWRRANRLLSMNVFTGPVDLPALELACHAWTFPIESSTQTNRQHAANAVVAFTRAYPPACDQRLAVSVCRLLDELPERSPKLAEARLLADVVNLDQLGIAGLLQEAGRLPQGQVLDRLIAREAHRDAYGYWPARLKTSFHFEASRRMATERIEHARLALRLLQAECEIDIEAIVL